MPDTTQDATATARYQLVENLFFRASELPPAKRGEFLLAHCAHDNTLLEELESLLASDSSVNDLMASTNAPPVEEDPWIGRTLGGYHVDSLLGRGGMGVVYLGSRIADGLSLKVAIKLIARHLQSTPAQAQFLLERDALAGLHHPNIASLIDGGFTPEGLPFVVMEFIEGERLDVRADEPRTTLPEIAELIIQLCAAVSYAHRNLLLHRDIKPGNVMVTTENVVKLLDFGTIKGIGAKAQVDASMTEAGMRSLTLRYASPEHIRGDPPSTSMDVYAIGMTLYRLLAGRLPEADADLTLTEHLYRLENRIPLAPSASMRNSRRKLDPALTADLDAIALKSIRFDPADRYESADDLAQDLVRALNSQPVSARASTARYRAGRFFARNRVFVLGAATALVVLAVGLPVMAHEATLARAQTVRAQAGVDDERKLTHLLLFDYFEQLKAIPGSTDPQHRTVTQAVQFLDSLKQVNALDDSALEADAVEAYTKMGQVLGSPYEENLGDVSGGIVTLKKAVELSNHLITSHPGVLAFQQEYLDANFALGSLYFGSGDPKSAENVIRPAAEVALRLSREPAAGISLMSAAASAFDKLGDVYDLQGAINLQNEAGAGAAYRQAIDIDRHALLRDATCARCRRGIAIEQWKLGCLYEYSDPDAAEQNFQAGLAGLALFTTQEKETTRVIRIDNLLRSHLGVTLFHLGQIKEGIQLLEEVQERFRAAIVNDPIDTRARFDLFALDFDLEDAYRDGNRPDLETRTVRERLDTINYLALHTPTNAELEGHRAEAIMRWAATERMTHQNAAAQRDHELGIGLATPNCPAARRAC